MRPAAINKTRCRLFGYRFLLQRRSQKKALKSFVSSTVEKHESITEHGAAGPRGFLPFVSKFLMTSEEDLFPRFLAFSDFDA